MSIARRARLLFAAGITLVLVLAGPAAKAAGADESYHSGMAALNEGNVVAAMEQFTAALEVAPTHARAAFERGKLLLAIGEPRLAVADFTTVILSGGAEASAYAWRGHAKAILNDDPGAVTDFDKAVDLAPKDVDALVLRASYFLKKGLVGKAREDLMRAKAAADPTQAAKIQTIIGLL